MKKKWVIRMAFVLVLVIIVLVVFNNVGVSHTDAQGIVLNSATKVASSHVEIIKVSYPNGDYTIHARDRLRMMDVNLEYANEELILQKMISNLEPESTIVSIGKDFTTGEMVGSSWQLSQLASDDSRKTLKTSMVEVIMTELQSYRWVKVSEEIMQGVKVDKVKSDHEKMITFLYFEFETGLPIKQEIYTKDNMGNPSATPERVEEYSYLEAIPAAYLSTSQVVIKEGPAPLQRDIAD